jgi:hypothetical protein
VSARLCALFCFLLLIGSQILFAQQGETGYLKAKVNPGRAGVLVDGKYLGPAANLGFARKYVLPVGEHEVTLTEPRYQDHSTKVTIKAGKTTVIRQSLQALPPAKGPFGMLRTIGPDRFAAVFVNGKYMGHVDEFSNSGQRLLLPPGDYTVKIASAGSGQPYEEKIGLEADKTTVVEVK